MMSLGGLGSVCGGRWSVAGSALVGIAKPSFNKSTAL